MLQGFLFYYVGIFQWPNNGMMIVNADDALVIAIIY